MQSTRLKPNSAYFKMSNVISSSQNSAEKWYSICSFSVVKATDIYKTKMLDVAQNRNSKKKWGKSENIFRHMKRLIKQICHFENCKSIKYIRDLGGTNIK